jgi:hypothetical protein
MTDSYGSDGADREPALRSAAMHSAASRDIEEFLRRVAAVPEPADIVEYATLIAREQEIRAERDGAINAFGLATPSVEPE